MVLSLLLITFCYLVGAIPTSYLLVKGMLGKDIRTMGSGNSGATNTGRFLGRGGFGFVLLVDGLKAFLALGITALLSGGDSTTILCATAALYVGNAYSPFIGFAGGKGVATTVGIMLYLFPLWLFCACFLAFAAIALHMQRVDAASLGASALAPLLLMMSGYGAHSVLVALAIAVWVWLRHKENIISFMRERF